MDTSTTIGFKKPHPMTDVDIRALRKLKKALQKNNEELDESKKEDKLVALRSQYISSFEELDEGLNDLKSAMLSFNGIRIKEQIDKLRSMRLVIDKQLDSNNVS